MRIVGIIQCRTGSTRLPDKALMPLAGRPMIQRYIERCKRIKGIDVLVLATTELTKDDILCDIADMEDIKWFRGSENDLVDRIYKCALEHKADIIVRLCADNPLIEPEEVDSLILNWKKKPRVCSLFTNTHGGGFPDGLGAEIYSLELFRWLSEGIIPANREHPHEIFYDRDAVEVLGCPSRLNYPELKLDVNTQKEYDYISEIYDKYGSFPRFKDYAEDLCQPHGKI